MVPTSYSRLDSFRLTPNGKIDRLGLPAPIRRRADLDTAYVAPETEREQLVADVYADILELDQVGLHDDFFALGGDSLDAVECGLRIERALGIGEIPVREMYAHPTVATLLPALDGLADAEIDWAVEATPRLVGRPPAVSRPPRAARSVVLDGPAGSSARTCSRRSRPVPGRRVVASWHWFAPAIRSRASNDCARLCWPSVVILVRTGGGSTWSSATWRLARFGLDKDAFTDLADRIDAIIHNGAWVHHLYDYRHLRAANVGGTQEVLRLAQRAGNAAVRYVSSISTTLEARDGALVERADAATVPPLGTGYGESKWVAERLILAARDHGIPTQSIRLSRAMTALRSGATSTNDAVVHLLRGCLDLGVYPQWSGWEPWTPVDLIAEVLATASFDLEDAPAIAYPPAAIAGLTRFFGSVASYGYALSPVPVTEWRAALAAAEHNAAAPVAEEFGLLSDQDAHGFGDVPPGRNWRMSPQLPGPAAPPVDNEYVWRMLDYLISIGYLPRPGRAQ